MAQQGMGNWTGAVKQMGSPATGAGTGEVGWGERIAPLQPCSPQLGPRPGGERASLTGWFPEIPKRETAVTLPGMKAGENLNHRCVTEKRAL